MPVSSCSPRRILNGSLAVIVFLFINGHSSAQTTSAPLLSEDEKAAIIRTAIDLWFSRAKQLPPSVSDDLLKFNVLSTDELSFSLVSKLSGIRLVMRNQNYLRENRRPMAGKTLQCYLLGQVG